MTRKSTGPIYGTPMCPANPEHGQLLDIRGMTGYWCPHIDHMGRPKTHPQGEDFGSKSKWSLDEIGALQAA